MTHLETDSQVTGSQVVPDTAAPRHLLERFNVLVSSDSPWQQRARLLQSLWRADHGWEMGRRPNSKTDALLGSVLNPTHAAAGQNFIDDAARAAADHAIVKKEVGAVIEEGRLRSNMLSSQTLCFNLFAGLYGSGRLAATLDRLLPQLGISTVDEVRFEHSPGRGAQRYSGDASAIDVAVIYVTREGRRGLVGFEVKYHENLVTTEVVDSGADWLDVPDETKPELTRGPLVQFTRDHRLVHAIGVADSGEYPAGATWVLLYPGDNTAVARAAARYEELTAGRDDRAFITLESFLAAAALEWDSPTVDALHARYLDVSRLAALNAPLQTPRPRAATWWDWHGSAEPGPEGDVPGSLCRRARLAMKLHQRWFQELGVQIYPLLFTSMGGDEYSWPVWSPRCLVAPRYFGRLSTDLVHIADESPVPPGLVRDTGQPECDMPAPAATSRAGLRKLEQAMGLHHQVGHERCPHQLGTSVYPLAWTLAFLLRNASWPGLQRRYMTSVDASDDTISRTASRHRVPLAGHQWVAVFDGDWMGYGPEPTLVACLGDGGLAFTPERVLDIGALSRRMTLGKIAGQLDPRFFEQHRNTPKEF